MRPRAPEIDQFLRPHVAGVEAAHEADLHRNLHLTPEVHDPLRFGEVLGDWLLGPDGLAGPKRRLDERGVQRGRVR